MKRNTTFQIIFTSLFSALICVATMLIQIYIPSTGGYANAGDGIILMCAFLMLPRYSVTAAMIGSFLADVLAGYAIYAPGTLIIKGLVALTASLLLKYFSRKNTGAKAFAVQLAAGIIAELVMVAGYFLYEAVILSYGFVALSAIPANVAQGIVGILIAMILTPVLCRSHEVSALMKKLNE